MKSKWLLISVLGLLLCLFVLDAFNVLPKATYTNDTFGFESIISDHDADFDGVDDQSDILLSAKAYLRTKPKYKSKYYGSGYPDDEYGVCTDVVAFALLHSGYDIMMLLNVDVKQNRDAYTIEVVDKNIDFRRVQNLHVYFKRHAQSLTMDIHDHQAWQGGDIVVFKRHIGIISNIRNKQGIPYVLHLANPYQIRTEEDILEKSSSEIVGHYRITSPLK
ncbi:MAG: DUF1287 domain-containing protein [Erysipelotrichaceae bacterium]|nr:DUF1287 domain-containing protein [Erysipelotrichaceae bacterium]